ncbi:MAG: IPT/TIG domain-containing protein, partial [Actinobacteria bacterium]|nr:IPT/TIG domain-containing protein [Actinomycetota bacterium]
CVAAGQSATNSAIEGVAVPVALSSNGTVSAGTPVDVSGTVSLDAITCTSSTSSTSAGTCVATGESTNVGSIIVRTVNGVPDAPSTAVAPANFLNVQDPASQPYVTSVGGTTLSAVGPPPAETAWNNASGAGGGGISTFWVMPSWQHGSGVISQNSSGIPCNAPTGSYCREVPDVSASADPNHGYVFYYGTWQTAGGTGAATIVWAAATVLANEGCSTPAGFADPALYSHPSDLNNVTGGNNDWTGTHNGLYPATAGYNMATGLGTPTAAIFTTGFLCSSTASHPAISSITPDSSPLAGGGTATIVGSGLSGATAVHFGAIAATDVQSISSTEVTAIIPAASTPGATGVTVTTPAGTTSPSGFVYVTSGLSYMPLVPYRIADTRCAANPQPIFCKSENLPSQNMSLTPPSAGGSITIQVTGTGSTLGSVPSGAQSAVLNVTAVAGQSAHPGYLTVYPAGTDPPTASSLNYVPGEAVPNLVTATIGKDGAISILSSSAGVNIVVDVEGYYGPSLPAGSRFNPLPLPLRVLDTRCAANPQPSFCKSENLPSQNMSLHAPGPGKGISISITGIDGSSGIPSSGVTAVSLVATSAGPSSGGYMTLWPYAGSCSTPPMASNVNFHKGAASANSVTVASGNYGKLCIYNSASTATNAVIDVNGYFSSTGDTFTPSSPVRICDTRDVQAIGGTGDVASGVTGRCANSGIALNPSISSTDPMTVQVAGEGGVPLSAKAAVANVTVAGTTGNGYLKIWPAGASQPPTSSMNWVKGETIPNMAVARLANSGQVAIYTSTGAGVIIDVVGWYS